MADLTLHNIGELTTNDGQKTADGCVVVADGQVVFAGSAADAPSQDGNQVDCRGNTVLPGFVDAHTHLVFAGDRSDEFRRRLEGESYSEIAAAGGGILATVEATRACDADELFELSSSRVKRMITAGTTTLEIKSGYGLDLETELRILKVAKRLGEEMPVTVKTTFLGAHSVPPEFKGDSDAYVDAVIEMLPVVSEFADYCDVFVEHGVFEVPQARTVFEAAAEFGLGARVHAEQLSHLGGAALAAELGAASADHLDHATAEDARALADAGVVAVLVPGASFTLGSPQAPGPMLLEAGCEVALATDCNPGTSYFEAMSPIIALAVVQMGLTVDQAVRAATLGGAVSLGLDGHGTLKPGAPADLMILDAPSAAHIPYRPGTDLVAEVYKAGQRVA